jgi:hypothetical protein
MAAFSFAAIVQVRAFEASGIHTTQQNGRPNRTAAEFAEVEGGGDARYLDR